MAQSIIYLGTKPEFVVNFTLSPFYPGQSALYKP